MKIRICLSNSFSQDSTEKTEGEFSNFFTSNNGYLIWDIFIDMKNMILLLRIVWFQT